MRRTPLCPSSTARQKAALPTPLGLTTPIPVMTQCDFIAVDQAQRRIRFACRLTSSVDSQLFGQCLPLSIHSAFGLFIHQDLSRPGACESFTGPFTSRINTHL